MIQLPLPDTRTFFEHDFAASLFPLKTNLLMMQHHAAGLSIYVQRALSKVPADQDYTFLAQSKSHAAKPRNHLRRTAVLDPVATFYIYDFVFRNHQRFNLGGTQSKRRSFGYTFNAGAPVPVHKAFQDFSNAIDIGKRSFRHCLSFDIASYFNSLYHHDLAHWLLSVPGMTRDDADEMAVFLREANSGRSIDCLPQGIYPTKMIGSAFLAFIEANGQLQCSQTYRFMDDIYLFDNSEQVLVKDFLLLQQLLGQFALNVNPTKTAYDGSISSVASTLSDIQAQLDAIIDEEEPRIAYFGSGSETMLEDYDDQDDDDVDHPEGASGALTSEQSNRLFELLLDPRAEESDVDRILRVLLRNTESLASAVPVLLKRFPNIVKQLHQLAGLIEDKESLATGLLEMLSEQDVGLGEYQLFWAAVIAEDHLSTTTHFGAIVMRLYNLTGEYEIARAKVLEIPDQSFGLKEIRDSILKSGASSWAAWSSAMGTRSLPRAARNHTLKYFAKRSPINQLIADCVRDLP